MTVWVLMRVSVWHEESDHPLGVFTSNDAANEHAKNIGLDSWETIPFGLDNTDASSETYTIKGAWDKFPNTWVDGRDNV